MQTPLQNLFPVYANSAAVIAALGVQPPFNAAQPFKQWADPAAAADPNGANPYTYLKVQETATGATLVPFTLPAAIAGSFNLPPPKQTFPSYSVPPTQATYTEPNFAGVFPEPSNLVASPLEATTLAASLKQQGLSADATAMDLSAQNGIKVGGDGRGYWVIEGTVGSDKLSVVVGLALLDEYQYGIGAPGEWIIAPVGNGTAGIKWVSHIVPPPPLSGPSVPIPAGAPLQPGQTIVGSFGAGPGSNAGWYVVTPDQSASINANLLAELQALLSQLEGK